ncbi:MAG TPA: pirin family protein [Caulobacteraceae bacterium]|jgi:redox-sensitive bicupin YhaK (pirin superfamily)|nr:pirin family protein [Caulobacteraceae bacterium]
MTVRPVMKVTRGEKTSDGAGVKMTRVLGTPDARMFDPFLMLDHFNTDNADDYIGGFPEHPHRGFETVTYMLDGKMRHGDNTGREGVIQTGGIQWMRAGRGIVHSEMPEQTEGRMRGFQLWVNLPGKLKMSDPDYQEFDADKIPVEERQGGGAVKVIAGTTGRGTRGPVGGGAVDALYFDVSLIKGQTFSEAVGADRNVMIVSYEGMITVAGRLMEPVSAAFMGPGDEIEVTADDDARFLVIAGKPLGEPVAWGGPFVMNTREEVMQAYQDFQSGRF